MPQSIGPLTGVRVLDLTRYPPGGYCTVLLADLGAEVCRIQPPGAGLGMLSVALGRNKRSIAVNLRDERGIAVLRKLAGWADVLVETDRPGAMDERGFGYATASTEFPGLIWCSITGFGQSGPLASSSGHDLSYVAHSGLLTAINSNLPWYPQTILAIPTGATLAALGIVAALRERDRTGQGCQIDISMSEAATWLLSSSDGELNGNPWEIPDGPDRHLYQCADGGWIALGSARPRTWTALCIALGVEDLGDSLHRWEHPESVVEQLAAIFKGRSAADWVASLVPKGVAIVCVNRAEDLHEDLQSKARGTLTSVGDVLVPHSPIRFQDGTVPLHDVSPQSPRSAGADSRSILSEAGLSSDEIAELVASGVVGVE